MPARFTVGPASNVSDDIFAWAARSPDHVSFARKVDGAWQSVTARAFVDQVVAVAAGLIASGVRSGDRIGLIADTSYEWVVCDYAIWAAGAVTVPAYPTAAPAQIADIIADSGATGVFVKSGQVRSMVADACPALADRLWTADDSGFAALSSSGVASAEEVESRRRSASADSTATIVYTSGTTGQPKGCVLTHRNLVAQVSSILEAEDIDRFVLVQGSSMLVFLPLAHVLARVATLAAVRAGMRIGLSGDLSDLQRELAAFQPEVTFVVPRILEKVYNRAERKAQQTGRGRLFRAAAETAVAYSRALADGSPSRALRMRRALFDKLLYARLRAAFGGRLRYAGCGGAPLDTRLGHFMRGIGLNVLDGWGLTETAAPITLNLPAARRVGTVGRPLPGNTVKINPDGEVLVKGPAVFRGYWNNPQATDEVLDADGWLHTGDLGELHDGFLSVVGRKKDLIVTASGKNVAPAFLEDRVAAHWLIEQCVVVGERRPYIAALIALDPESFEEWKAQHHLPISATVADLHDNPELRGAVQGAVDEVNEGLSRPERIKRFRIVPSYFTVGDELTPTQKTRRQYVLAQFADEVEALYAEEERL
ncbi:MAG TPA: long-chain fatty acid--CoA ligase [Actinocrinis sp.]|nr:long-chain fatty acid--CoA ligase [Actinocrinis sp.]